MEKFLLNRSGQVMVEAVVALTVLAFGISGIFVLFSNSLGLNRLSTDEYIASGLASEGIEVVKNILDSNYMLNKSGTATAWNNGLANCTLGCSVQYDSTAVGSLEATPLSFHSSTGTYDYGASGTSTKFTRTITISGVVNNEITIISRIDWTGLKGLSYNLVLEDHVFNWRP